MPRNVWARDTLPASGEGKEISSFENVFLICEVLLPSPLAGCEACLVQKVPSRHKRSGMAIT